ncbi:MAG: DUF7213 family protein [Mycobacterium sp.]
MTLTPAQLVERALQCLLDSCGDGWTLSGFVVVMGLERVADGDIESASWVYTAPNQPGWVTSGLLIETDGMFDRAGED